MIGRMVWRAVPAAARPGAVATDAGGLGHAMPEGHLGRTGNRSPSHCCASKSVLRRYGRVLLLGVLGVAALSSATVVAQVVPSAHDSVPEPVLLELQIGRLARRTIRAFRIGTEALLPVTQVFELAEVRYRLSLQGRLEAQVDPGHRRLVIDAQRDSMTFGSHAVRLEREFRMFHGGDLYVGAERLGDLLGSRVIVDWGDLVVTLVDPSDLPLGRRVRREAERAAFVHHGARLAPDLDVAPERPYWDGLVFDYSFFAPSSAPVDGSAYTAALGADAFGGSLEVGMHSVGSTRDGAVALDASWVGVWRDRPWLRQLRLGDGLTTGPYGRALRGVAATNAPYLRPSRVGDLVYDGRLDPGWSLEAYRGGKLVAYDSTDARGRFALDLPVDYGENPVDFVAYGPFGEIREFNRTYRVLADLLPARRFEWGVSGGECRTTLCTATGNVDVRYGVSRGWTVRGGVDAFWRDSLADRIHPYLSVLGTPANAWAVEFEGVVGALARATARYEPSLNLHVGVEGTVFASDAAPPLLVPQGRRSQWAGTAFWRPAGGRGFAFAEARLERVEAAAGSETRARIGGSLQAAGIRWFPFVRAERTPAVARTRTFTGVDVIGLPRPGLGPVLGPLWWRGSLEVGASGGARWAASASRPLGSGWRAEIAVSWASGAPGPTYTMVLTSLLPMLRSSTAVTAPGGGPALATQLVQGSLLWDGARRVVAATAGPSLQRAGVAGVVFFDENGNGVRDPGERGVPQVRLLVGATRAVTDSSGRYRVWDLVPFEPVLVTVDSLSLRSPLEVPGFAAARVVPGPNRFRVFDVPIVRAGVLEGRVEQDGRAVPGVTLTLTDRRTGVQRQFATFSDGAFYVLGVKPGDYELTVPGAVRDALGVSLDPLLLTITAAGRDGVVVTLKSRL